MFSMSFRFHRPGAGACGFVAAGVLSAVALTGCGQHDASAAAAAPTAEVAPSGTPVPPAPTAALAPAPAVVPPPVVPAPQIAVAPTPPQPGYAASPQPVPPATHDDLARSEPAPVPTRDARVAQRPAAPR